MKKLLLTGAIASILAAMPTTTNAQTAEITNLRADSHAPIGVMGDHMHKKGDFMISVRAMHMDMKDNRDGTSDLSPEKIVTTIPNRFSGTAGQPSTLRVVPTEMTTDMVMIGGMYAPIDNITLMVMGNYLDREMDLITFQGGAGTTGLGEFTTKNTGWGDTKASALIRIYEDNINHLHINAGISLPTGSIDGEDDILTPMNMRPTQRLPYAMQLGSGTFDLMPGITYSGKKDKFGWGAQYNGTIHLGDNSEDYSWGDKHQVSAWGNYLINHAVSISGRVNAEHEGSIDGIDSAIVAPVQTADPDNYGGNHISMSLGINTIVTNGSLKGHRFSIEGNVPVYQDLNGPQMKRDYAITVGWSKGF